MLTLNKLHDIRSSHLLGRQLLLGTAGKAVYLSDLEWSKNLSHLTTSSDVFAIERREVGVQPLIQHSIVVQMLTYFCVHSGLYSQVLGMGLSIYLTLGLRANLKRPVIGVEAQTLTLS